ncbi:MAG: hypothetical protein R3A44_38495 [Caldilineaceae bacterium]
MYPILHHPLPYWQSLPWHSAPRWAHWAAMDTNGRWFWYENTPTDEDGYFTAHTGRLEEFRHLPYPGYWRFSLQHRPVDTPAFLSSALVTDAPLPA